MQNCSIFNQNASSNSTSFPSDAPCSPALLSSDAPLFAACSPSFDFISLCVPLGEEILINTVLESLGVICCALTFIFGSLSNGLIIYISFFLRHSRHAQDHTCYTSLATSDIISSLFLPWATASQIWINNEKLVSILSTPVQVFSLTTNAGFLAIVALTRCHQIRERLQHLNPYLVEKAQISVWTFASFATLGVTIYTAIKGERPWFILKLMFIPSLMVALICTVIGYLSTYKFLKQCRSFDEKTYLMRMRRCVITGTSLTGCFLFFMTLVILALHSKNHNLTLTRFFRSLSYFQYIVNPWIYGFRSSKFRYHVRSILKLSRETSKAEVPSLSSPRRIVNNINKPDLHVTSAV